MYWNVTDKERLFIAFEIAGQDSQLLREFLGDFFTEKEKKIFIARMRALCMLSDSASYSEIREITHLSFATIARLVKTINNRDVGIPRVIKKFRQKGRKYID